MSSPIYPGFIEDLSPEDLQNLSEIDAAVSQSDYSAAPIQLSTPSEIHAEGSKSSQLTGDKLRASKLGSEANDDPVTTRALPTSAHGTHSGLSVPTTLGFTPARAIVGNVTDYDYNPSSPEPPQEDHDSWFNTSSTAVPAFVGFQSCSTANETGFIGFTSVGKGVTFQPSEAAIQKVKKRMRDWEADIDEELSSMRPNTPQCEVPSPQRPVTPPRSSLGLDKSPTLTPSRPTSPQHTAFTRSAKQKQFKPPLLSKTNLTSPLPASPSRPAQSRGSVPLFKPPLLAPTSASTVPKPMTPSRVTPDSAFRTPVRPGGVQRPGSVKKFTTPFKPGMRPGEPGRAKLQDDQERKRSQERQTDQVFQIQMHSPPRKPVYDVPPSLKSPSGSRKGKEKAKEHRFFDLSRSPRYLVIKRFGDETLPQHRQQTGKRSPRGAKYPSRIPGMSSNLWECKYPTVVSALCIPQLTAIFNRNVEEMSQITPETAIHYSFYSPSGPLGPVDALKELQNEGCTLVTEDWVYNHWGLILWKQAGMLCLDPTEAQRWSWEETMNQLRYRYA